MNKKAVIFGIKGYKITIKEKQLFKKIKPWGIILFSRNIQNIQQLKFLVDDIKKVFGSKKFPILIDTYLIYFKIIYSNFNDIFNDLSKFIPQNDRRRQGRALSSALLWMTYLLE